MKKILITVFAIFQCLALSAQANLTLFEPEFYAYRVGRINVENGEGRGWYKRFCLFHITDVHKYDRLMSEAINVAQTKCDVIVNSGDNCNGGSKKDRQDNLQTLDIAADTIIHANIKSIPFISVPGNHDVAGITKQDYFDRIDRLVEKFTPSVQWGDKDHYRSYGYLDIESNQHMGTFRIIMLDPFDYPDGSFGEVRTFMTATFSQKQIDWFIASLKDAAEKKYHVITVMHYAFGDNDLIFNEEKAKPDAYYYQDPFMIPDIIDAVQNGTKLTKKYDDKLGINNIEINEDFSNIGELDYVCHLFGHIHSKNEHWCQKSNGSKKYDILMLGEGALGAYGNILNKVYREPGTINEIEFSALAIDTREKNIYRISYGAYLKYDKSNSERTEKFHYRLTE